MSTTQVNTDQTPDFVDTSIFQRVVEFTAHGQQYQAQQMGIGAGGNWAVGRYDANRRAYLPVSTVSVRGRATPRKIYDALANSDDIDE